MNSELEARWRELRTPFEGVTVESGWMSLSELRSALFEIVGELHRRFGDRALWRVDDWHEHDGYLMSERSREWDGLRSCVSSVDALAAESPEDTYVRAAWYPETASFYFRWCVTDYPDDLGGNPGDGVGGVLDLTGEQSLVDAVASILRQAGVEATTLSAAKFFDEGWAG